MRWLLGILLVVVPIAASAQDRQFDQVVAPLLVDRCIDCHSGAKPKGKLDLTKKASAARVVIPKDLKESTLWQQVEAGKMPPKKPLSDKEKAILKTWIDSGAAWGTDPIDPFRITTSRRAGYDWWALQPVKRPDPPKVKRQDWPRNPIDHFILAKLEAEGLGPSPEEGPLTLRRRLYFDLTGLPPSPDDALDFLKEYQAGNKPHAALADRLLASRSYGERWARHWLDVVRFGESHGFEHDELRKNAWPYRDWVINAINKDMPYDAFARLQIAGDVLKSNDPDSIAATGFLVAGGYDSVGQGQQSAAMKAVVRQDELEDVVGTIGQTFLGLTVQCARCHDHKFDPVRIEEYYRLTAAVAGVRHGERDVTAAPLRLAFEKRLAESRAKLDELRATLADLEKPIRAKILAERSKIKSGQPVVKLPKAIARWDFTKSGKDEIAGTEAKLHNGATLKSDGLHLPGGTSFASTAPLDTPIGAKTLTAVVRLHNLKQRGGAALSLQSADGALFDAIVFGERQAGHWMAGSDFFRRTKDFEGPAETDANAVHIAIVFHPDGTIAAFRNGVAYGKPYKSANPLKFDAKGSMLLFGLRHAPVGGAKHLDGTIVRAELYGHALSPQEIAASAGVASDYIAVEEIVRHLDGAGKAKHADLMRAIAQAEVLLAAPPPATRVYAVTPRAPEMTYLLDRGNPTQKGKLLGAGGVAALGLKRFDMSVDAADADRRRKLAEWITDARNPLFARVMVNRLWHHHFGAGLVETPSDFGFNGGRPSHPELLDWLADEFVRSGYSMKHIHRLIVNSATYRQSSRFHADAAKRDAGNRWLWRKSPLRLEAEAVRDAILSVAGQLNDAPGGPGYQDFKLTIRGATHYYTPIEDDTPALYRRSIYRTWARSGRNGLLDALDCPDPSTVSPRRAVTTTPLQALSMLNNAFVLRMADRFAGRLKKEAGNDVGKQVMRAYELAYGRRATDEEIARVRPAIERHGLAVFCRAVFNSNEFVYVD
ncbi:MAG: DUF1553 domain-containing protein [Planctomycetes bacterium]|nr:DUF1553 domain-containing protein [Planctomycetota bacterium]